MANGEGKGLKIMAWASVSMKKERRIKERKYWSVIRVEQNGC